MSVDDRLRNTAAALCVTYDTVWPSVQICPSPWLGWAAISFPAEPEPILTALLPAEELEHAKVSRSRSSDPRARRTVRSRRRT